MKKMERKALVSGDTQTIHDFIRNADFVEGPDDLWPLVAFDGETVLRGVRHKCGPVFLIGHHVNHGHDF
jgi:hypothetical protein